MQERPEHALGRGEVRQPQDAAAGRRVGRRLGDVSPETPGKSSARSRAG